MSNITQQQVRQISIQAVKGLRNVTIDFAPNESMVTGIFGPNGCGKSTILHLLACCYTPVSPGVENHRFSDFFLPTSSHQWSGSEFAIAYSQAQAVVGQAPNLLQAVQRFEKKTGRWAPRYESRPMRDCYYMGISTCVPRIEVETQNTRIQFTGSTPAKSQAMILKNASYILNRDYTSYHEHSAKGGTYIGVSNSVGSYTELSMGAGEQRVFRILEKIYLAPKYSLVLIDEVDLLLHEVALSRFVGHLRDYCKEKAIQLVFTAHRHSLLDIADINVRHIIQTPKATFCLTQTTPDALTQLTLKPVRPLRIYVEDDLAEAIVNKLLEGFGAHRYATVTRYGSIMNAFTLAGAAVLNKTLDENDLFILDGDQFRETNEREKRMKQVMAGDDPSTNNVRIRALEAIRQFSLPAAKKPEVYIWELLRAENPQNHSGVHREIVTAACRLAAVSDSHDFINRIIEQTGYQRTNGLTRVIDTLALTPAWEKYVMEVSSWIKIRLSALVGEGKLVDYGGDAAPIIDHDAMILITGGSVTRRRSFDLETIHSSESDAPVALLGGSTEENIVFFSSRGVAYVIRIRDLPSSDSGASIQTLFSLMNGELIVAASTTDPRFMPEFAIEKPNLGVEYEEPYPHFVAVTKKGRAVRFTGWPHKSPSRPSGRPFGKLKEGDAVIDVIKMYAEDDVVVITKKGMLLRCSSQEVNLLNRAGVGVTLIRLAADDEVIGTWKSDAITQLQTTSGEVVSVKGGSLSSSSRGGRGRAIIRQGAIKAVLKPPLVRPDFDLVD